MELPIADLVDWLTKCEPSHNPKSGGCDRLNLLSVGMVAVLIAAAAIQAWWWWSVRRARGARAGADAERDENSHGSAQP